MDGFDPMLRQVAYLLEVQGGPGRELVDEPPEIAVRQPEWRDGLRHQGQLLRAAGQTVERAAALALFPEPPVERELSAWFEWPTSLLQVELQQAGSLEMVEQFQVLPEPSEARRRGEAPPVPRPKTRAQVRPGGVELMWVARRRALLTLHFQDAQQGPEQLAPQAAG